MMVKNPNNATGFQLNEVEKPMKEVTYFNLIFDGGMGNQSKLILKNGQFEVYCLQCNHVQKEYTPSANEWSQFWGQLDYLDAWHWSSLTSWEYVSSQPYLTQVSFDRIVEWKLEMIVDGSEIVLTHENNSSKQFGQDLSRSLLDAISKLSNGLFRY